MLFGGDQLAIILRDDDPSIVSANHWDFPGGGREGDDTIIGMCAAGNMERVGHLSGDRWCFVAHVSVCVVDKITLGDEGPMWRLMSPEQYFKLPNHIPQFADRFRLYLSGVVGDSFESAPSKFSGWS